MQINLDTSQKFIVDLESIDRLNELHLEKLERRIK